MQLLLVKFYIDIDVAESVIEYPAVAIDNLDYIFTVGAPSIMNA